VSQDARRAKRAGKVVLQLYREHAPYVANAIEKKGVTCKEGCAHCCMIPATATVPEMVPVVEELTSRSDWKERKPLLERELTKQLQAFDGVNILNEVERTRFFNRKIACMFLKDKRCEIYTLRPASCRYHMVVTSPDNCAHGASSSEVILVDLHKIENDVTIQAAKAFGSLTGGPIALAFVLAADLLGVKLTIDRTLLDRVMISHIEIKA
jgi:Fe-S-cluster containining protein